jgi:2-polyprenyl-6-methoxyphenol hydroxylase-like FAD-dependent oxidoreductase
LQESGRVIGVHANTPHGSIEVRADIVVGADGRNSIVREKAGLKVKDCGAPMDVLWFRLSRSPDDPIATMGRFGAGRIFIMINRSTAGATSYPKVDSKMRDKNRFREEIRQAPFARDRLSELRTGDGF